MEQKKSTLNGFNEVDSCLKALGNLDDKIQKTEGEMNEKVEGIKTPYVKKLDRWGKEKQELMDDLKLFLEDNKKSFKAEKTKKFTHGEISQKTGAESLALFNKNTWDDVINHIEEHCSPKEIKQFIKTAKSVDKNALKKANVPIDKLKKIGAKLVRSISFSIKLYKDKSK